MLREIGLGTLLLIILTIVVGVVALMQTAEFGPFATSSIGVTSETALTWGQNAEMVTHEEEGEAAEEMEATESAEATEEAGG